MYQCEKNFQLRWGSVQSGTTQGESNSNVKLLEDIRRHFCADIHNASSHHNETKCNKDI